MTDFIRSLFRHFKLAQLGTLIGANVFCTLPFLAALGGPLLLKNDLNLGLMVLLTGFVLTGQAVAVTGRLFSRRFRNEKKQAGALLRAWADGWLEGLVIAALLLGLFSLLFQSVPFYWAQGTEFAVFSLITLDLGTVLVLGFLPYFLPARRTGLGLAASFGRAFRLMNAQPLLALAGALLSAVSIVATLGSFGLFPGFTGLGALHQGQWDHAVEKEASDS